MGSQSSTHPRLRWSDLIHRPSVAVEPSTEVIDAMGDSSEIPAEVRQATCARPRDEPWAEQPIEVSLDVSDVRPSRRRPQTLKPPKHRRGIGRDRERRVDDIEEQRSPGRPRSGLQRLEGGPITRQTGIVDQAIGHRAETVVEQGRRADADHGQIKGGGTGEKITDPRSRRRRRQQHQPANTFMQ